MLAQPCRSESWLLGSLCPVSYANVGIGFDLEAQKVSSLTLVYKLSITDGGTLMAEVCF